MRLEINFQNSLIPFPALDSYSETSGNGIVKQLFSLSLAVEPPKFRVGRKEGRIEKREERKKVVSVGPKIVVRTY